MMSFEPLDNLIYPSIEALFEVRAHIPPLVERLLI